MLLFFLHNFKERVLNKFEWIYTTSIRKHLHTKTTHQLLKSTAHFSGIFLGR